MGCACPSASKRAGGGKPSLGRSLFPPEQTSQPQVQGSRPRCGPGLPPPTGPLVLWSELLFKRNFRPVSRSGSPSVHGVSAALPGGGRGGCRGAGRPAFRSRGPVTEETRAGEGGAVAWRQHSGPRQTPLGPARGLAAVKRCDAGGVLSLVEAFFVTAVLASWPGNPAVCVVSALASSHHLFSFKEVFS